MKHIGQKSFSPVILSRIRILFFTFFFPSNLSQGLVLDQTLTVSSMMMQHNIIDCGAFEVSKCTCQPILMDKNTSRWQKECGTRHEGISINSWAFFTWPYMNLWMRNDWTVLISKSDDNSTHFEFHLRSIILCHIHMYVTWTLTLARSGVTNT